MKADPLKTGRVPVRSRLRRLILRRVLTGVLAPARLAVFAPALGLLLVAWPTLATVPLRGEFRATQDCPLFRSIRKGTQVEGSRLVPGQAYPLLGKNREEATHLLIRVPGLESGDVWVEVGCGDISGPGQGAGDPEQSPAPADPDATLPRSASADAADARAVPQRPALADPRSAPSQPAPADPHVAPQQPAPAVPQAASQGPSPAAPGSALATGDFVLAATWHPAFCEIQTKKPECSPTPKPANPGPGWAQQRSPAQGQGFALHGLWPQPRERAFCQVPAGERAHAEEGRWSRLPALDLSADTRQRLSVLMPGVASHLDRYQWSKHGSCQAAPPEDYFRAALDALEQLNASAVTGLFATHVGERLAIGDIRAAFDRAFGPGTGKRVGLSCREDLIVELRLSLRGQPGAAPLGDLMRAAPVQAPGCEGGYVDAPGRASR